MERRPALAIALTATALLAACSSSDGGATSSSSTATQSATSAAPGTSVTAGASDTSTVPAPASSASTSPGGTTAQGGTPDVSITPAADAVVAPNTPVTVRATGGTLGPVTVTSADGQALPGGVKDGVWTASSGLVPGSRYTVNATVLHPDGTSHPSTSSFTAKRAGILATYHVLYDNMTVGVGAPVSIQFDSPVASKAMKAEIERHALVTTAPAVQGSWGWLDDRQLMWRPAEFWKPGTKVTLKANLQGLQTGENKYVGKSATGVFTVGPAMISSVDMVKHEMTVTRDGKVLKTIPVSTGKSTEERFVTRSGTKVIIDKSGDMTMDSSTVGIPKGNPQYYKLDTRYNLRVTWTGEFLHAAPWSVGAQGRANVSHGCTNMSLDNAAWMFQNSNIGDVVKFTGSNRPFLPTEGIGVWEYTFDQWKARSALAA